jgi:hypothetical protein
MLHRAGKERIRQIAGRALGGCFETRVLKGMALTLHPSALAATICK